ncbi:MAG: hypothetical protein J6N21_15560 [Butyrivibrio sp.]|nr:hypothetical protein [Butyrivibrio sp.]
MLSKIALKLGEKIIEQGSKAYDQKWFPYERLPGLFPVAGNIIPALSQTVGYVDFISKSGEMPLLIQMMDHLNMEVKYQEFEKNGYPNCEIIIITIPRKHFKQFEDMLNKLPNKVHELYGGTKKEKNYSKYSGELLDMYKRLSGIIPGEYGR